MRWDFERVGFERVTIAGLSAAFALCPVTARAEGRAVDPSYGRVDGDVGIVLGIGAVVAPRAPRAEAELRLRYLEAAGVFATYEDAGVVASPSEPRRVLVTGLELRPLFPFRWLKGYEGRHARLNLAVDSLGLDLAMMFVQPAGTAFASRAGFEVGLGVELPVLERASGPWIGLRGALRWSDAALGSGVSNANDRQAVLVVTFAWHQILAAHVIDPGDEAPR